MSTSARKYLEYIDQQVTIAPANSQEELQAANTMTEVFKAHDLDTQVQVSRKEKKLLLKMREKLME